VSLSPEALLELMALADGELEGDAKARVEKLVVDDEEARRVVDGMRSSAVALWLNGTLSARAASRDNDAIADAVMARLGAAGVPRGGVGPPSAARSPRPRSVRNRIAAAVGVSLALAAGAALFWQVATQRASDRTPMAHLGAPTVELAPAAPSAARSAQAGVEVQQIESPARGVSVFEIPAGSAAAAAGGARPSSVVIWIDDEPGPK
jgi:hypothetical protein